eukprot:CAMPEP_0170499212 /NCGR_PEP_ID=MMETSP0208-20121228/30555_1 /TAXON_ID=197538 /ORGANISM="Strombidium inclinatum, Strain S3" /LENGTH=67 /DNA_ID=CAMNT_0010776679 /DNA_START=993 /DNA_END=1193 /DNA_ORIENTATION=+
MTHPDLLKVLEGLLQFNPRFRPSAKSLLSLAVFDSVRRADLEVEASSRVVCSVDEEVELNYGSGEFA